MSGKLQDEPRSGPMEEVPWPEKLTARVVTPGARPRLHGYDVEGDLARHYSFAETVLLAFTGEPPDEARGRAFETALIFLSPISIAEAPTHAAAIARLAGSGASGVLATGAIGLAEQARFIVEDHEELLQVLRDPMRVLPDRYKARSDRDRETIQRLRSALPSSLRVPLLDADPAPMPALLGVLFACGLTRPEWLETAMVIARLAALFSEAFAMKPGRLEEYPMDLPSFRFSEE